MSMLIISYFDSINFDKRSESDLEKYFSVMNSIVPIVSNIFSSVGHEKEQSFAHSSFLLLLKMLPLEDYMMKHIIIGLEHQSNRVQISTMIYLKEAINSFGKNFASTISNKIGGKIISLIDSASGAIRDQVPLLLEALYNYDSEIRYRPQMKKLRRDQFETINKLFNTVDEKKKFVTIEEEQEVEILKSIKKSFPKLTDPLIVEKTKTLEIDELKKKMESIRTNLLSVGKHSWEEKANYLKMIKDLIERGACNYNEFFEILKTFTKLISNLLKESRAAIIHEATEMLNVLSENGGELSMHFLGPIMKDLIVLLSSANQILAEHSNTCIKTILIYSRPHSIPLICNHIIKDGHPQTRIKCMEYLVLLAEEGDLDFVNSNIEDIYEAIFIASKEANEVVRSRSRFCFVSLLKRWPLTEKNVWDKWDESIRQLCIKERLITIKDGKLEVTDEKLGIGIISSLLIPNKRNDEKSISKSLSAGNLNNSLERMAPKRLDVPLVESNTGVLRKSSNQTSNNGPTRIPIDSRPVQNAIPLKAQRLLNQSIGTSLKSNNTSQKLNNTNIKPELKAIRTKETELQKQKESKKEVTNIRTKSSILPMRDNIQNDKNLDSVNKSEIQLEIVKDTIESKTYKEFNILIRECSANNKNRITFITKLHKMINEEALLKVWKNEKVVEMFVRIICERLLDSQTKVVQTCLEILHLIQDKQLKILISNLEVFTSSLFTVAFSESNKEEIKKEAQSILLLFSAESPSRLINVMIKKMELNDILFRTYIIQTITLVVDHLLQYFEKKQDRLKHFLTIVLVKPNSWKQNLKMTRTIVKMIKSMYEIMGDDILDLLKSLKIQNREEFLKTIDLGKEKSLKDLNTSRSLKRQISLKELPSSSLSLRTATFERIKDEELNKKIESFTPLKPRTPSTPNTLNAFINEISSTPNILATVMSSSVKIPSSPFIPRTPSRSVSTPKNLGSLIKENIKNEASIDLKQSFTSLTPFKLTFSVSKSEIEEILVFIEQQLELEQPNWSECDSKMQSIYEKLVQDSLSQAETRRIFDIIQQALIKSPGYVRLRAFSLTKLLKTKISSEDWDYQFGRFGRIQQKLILGNEKPQILI